MAEEPRGTRRTMAGTERTDKLTGFEALGLLTGTRRGGDWSGAPARAHRPLGRQPRRHAPGHLFVALPGSQIHGAGFIPFALRMGAAAILTDAAGLAARRGRAAGRWRCRSSSATSRAGRCRWRRAAGTATSPRSMVAVTGTNGKTSVASFTRQIWEALGETRRQLRHRRRRGRGGGAAQPHDARADHAAPAARRPRRQGRDPCGDGGLEPRARPVPARRRAPGGGGLHQHHPRPPRLPPGLRGLLRRPSSGSSSGCCRSTAPRSSTSTTRTGRGSGGSPAARGQKVLAVGRAEGCELRLLGQRFDATGQELLFAWGGKSHKVRLELIGGFQAHERAGGRRPRHRRRAATRRR